MFEALCKCNYTKTTHFELVHTPLSTLEPRGLNLTESHIRAPYWATFIVYIQFTIYLT